MVALRFFRFPFLTFPIAFALWYMTMDLTPLLYRRKEFTWVEELHVSLYFGFAVVAVAYLMVSTWRFYSFKDIDLGSRQPFRLIILFALLFAAIRFYSHWVLFLIALLYLFSGVFWRLKWIFRRKGSPPPPPAYTEASQTL